MLTLLWLLVAVIVAVCFDTIWDYFMVWRLLQRRIKPQGRANLLDSAGGALPK